MADSTRNARDAAGKRIDFAAETMVSPASQRRSLLASVAPAALALNPAATLARWAAAFARAARAFFRTWLRTRSRRVAAAPRRSGWFIARTGAFAALAMFGLAWTATPAAAAIAGGTTPPPYAPPSPPPDCGGDPTCQSGDNVTTGPSTTVGDGSTLSVNTTYTTQSTVVGGSGGTLNVLPGASYTTSTLNVGQSTGDTGTVANWGTMTDDAVIGDAGTGTYNNYGVHNVSGNLILGNQSTGNGTYTIDGSATGAQLNVTLGTEPSANTPDTPIYPINGSVAGTPPNGALIVGNYGVGSFTQGSTASGDAPTVTVAGDLALGLGGQTGAGTAQGTYTINSGSLTVYGLGIIGNASSASAPSTFTQNGGSVSFAGGPGSGYASVTGWAGDLGSGTLAVGGVDSGGYGVYQMSGGTLTAQSIVMGFTGVGTFNQSGGTVTANFVDLNNCGGCNSAGFYNLTGTGQLDVDNINGFNGGLQVGGLGYGYFTQNGADTGVTVQGNLSIGGGPIATPNPGDANATPANYNRSGTYELDAGTLSTEFTIVGAGGQGTFLQTGGQHDVTYSLVVGQTNVQQDLGYNVHGDGSVTFFGGPSIGLYTMRGGTLVAGGDNSVGTDTSSAGIVVGDAGYGTFTQTGGSVTSGTQNGQRGNLVIGEQAGSVGQYNIGATGQTVTPSNPAPSLQVYGDAILGQNAPTPGQTTQVINTAFDPTQPVSSTNQPFNTVPIAAASGTLAVAGDGTSVSINQASGYDSHNGGNLIVGLNGTGAVTQTDQSTVYLDHNLVLGANQGASGSYTLGATSVSGTPDPTNPGSYNLFVGSDLNIGGMQTDVYGSNFQTTTNGGTGTFTLNSGDANVVGAINVGNNGGTGTLNVNGGTLTTNVGLSLAYFGTGNLNVSGGSLTVVGAAEIGVDGVGTVVQTGGAVTADYVDLSITTGNGSSSYAISGGSLTTSGLNVGGGGSGTAAFNQSGGAVNANAGLIVTDLQSTDVTKSNYTLSAGTLNTLSTTVGQGVWDPSAGQIAGAGSFTQSGGAHNVQTSLILGYSAGDNGVYTMTGGTLNTGLSSTGNPNNPYNLGDVIVGYGGTGEFDQSGGAVNSQSDNGVTIGWGGNGTYNLTGTGGLSVAGNLDVGVGGQGTFNQGDRSGQTSVTVGGNPFHQQRIRRPGKLVYADGRHTQRGRRRICRSSRTGQLHPEWRNEQRDRRSLRWIEPRGDGNLHPRRERDPECRRRLRRVRGRRARRDGLFQL